MTPQLSISATKLALRMQPGINLPFSNKATSLHIVVSFILGPPNSSSEATESDSVIEFLIYKLSK